MPLFAVERDLSQVPPEHFRSNLPGLVAACARLQDLGKKVRYISSAVFPAEARGLCLFGAEEPRWIQEANEAARLPYLRIFAVLDLTPTGVQRDLSRGRWPARVDATAAVPPEGINGGSPPRPATRVADEMARWSDEARQLVQVLGGWLEDAGRLQADVGTLESERAALAEEVRRLREESDGLRAERDDLSDALQTLAGQATRTADEVLQRIGGRRGAPGGLAER
jgi:folylpolyglutamate synthase/dihydropteroate synthase